MLNTDVQFKIVLIFHPCEKQKFKRGFLFPTCILISQQLIHQLRDENSSVNTFQSTSPKEKGLNKDVNLCYWFTLHLNLWRWGTAAHQPCVHSCWIYGCIIIRQWPHLHSKNCFHPSHLTTQCVILPLCVRHQSKWFMTLRLSKLPFISSLLLIKIMSVDGGFVD